MEPVNAPPRGRPAETEAGPLFTAAELAAYRRELDRLVQIRDHDLPELFRDARTFVAADTAEEIVQIHEDLAVIEARIRRLDETLREARVIDDDAAPELVEIGREIDVEYLDSGKVLTYRVTGSALSSGPGTISAGSPVGRALLGHAVGAVADVRLPGGKAARLRILAVRPGSADGD